MNRTSSAYDPAAFEEPIYQDWLRQGLFRSAPREGERPYTIVIPPPNVTGMLHMGHVLNNTLQDVLVRWRRMEGRETLWLPGTDHAGIATQNVVERHLRSRNLTRHDLGREAFTAEVWKWKEKNGATIIRQLQRMGCSCDWDRLRFTMDPGLSRAVETVFLDLYRKGLIYRGRYIVNWCPRCATALSDEEVIHRDVEGKLYHVRYPVDGGEGHLTVATTRPETMLGDTAVAVHPADERHRALIGRMLRLPLAGRTIPVVADESVDAAFGTGAVKVTPAHDPNDFEIARRHGLPAVVALDEHGRMTEAAGPFAGQDRFDCRRNVLAALEELGLLEKAVPHPHSVGHCQRCDTVVEPYLSLQWFVKMQPLAEPAIRAVEEGTVRFHPARWTGVYLNWMRNIRDWCISRQLWWGHRIPVWYCGACGEAGAGHEAPARCAACGGTALEQDPDVLDTWFSSWLWPFSTLGWPDDTKDLRYYYPTSALVTGGDIIFFWVARMIMAGLEFRGEAPFRDVHLHGMVRDAQGRRMSKSLGNSPDPLDLMAKTGADALRFALVTNAAEVEGLRYSDELLEGARNFANKLWNAWRLLAMNLPEGEAVELPPRERWELADRWILSRAGAMAGETTESLERFRLGEAGRELYQFAWRDYCDWYLELAKPRLGRGSPEEAPRAARGVTGVALGVILRLLHPYVPFVTEAIWREMPGERDGLGGPLPRAPWPRAAEFPRDEEAERALEVFKSVVTAVRNLRGELGVAPGQKVTVAVRPAGPDEARWLGALDEGLRGLARAGDTRYLGPEDPAPRPAMSAVAEGTEVYLLLEGAVDADRERERLRKEQARLEGLLAAAEAKLGSAQFRDKAKPEVVAREEAKREDLRISLAKVGGLLAQIGGESS